MRFRLVYALVAAALVLALVEGLCRLFPLGDPRLLVFDHHAFRNQPGAQFDRLLGFRLQKSRPGELLRQNAQGFVGPDIALPKPPGTFRIVCLGGSTTMGVGVDSDRFAYPALLERMLSMGAGENARRIEVVNAGVYGFTSLQTALRVTGELDDLEPDLYLFMDGLNDLDAAQALPRSLLARVRPAIALARSGNSTMARFFEPLARDLALSGLPVRVAEFARRALGQRESGQGLQGLTDKVRLFGHKANLARALQHAKARGIAAALVDEPMRIALPVRPGSPLPQGINPDLAQVLALGAQTIHDDNLELAERFCVPLVQTHTLFDPFLATPEAKRIFADDLHLSRYGYYLLARQIYVTLMGLPSVQQATGRTTPLSDPVLDKAFEPIWR